MKIFVPSWVTPGTYLTNLRFLEDKKEISGVELLFFICDDETRKLLEREFAAIEKYKSRFEFTAHLPEPLTLKHKPLVDMLTPLVSHFIVHPAGAENFPADKFVLENTELSLFEDALKKLPAGKPVCMDTGHLLLESRSPARFARQYGGRIKEVHLHGVDSGAARLDGKLPDHRALKYGEEWLKDLMPFLDIFNGVVNLEVFSWDEVKQSMKTLRLVSKERQTGIPAALPGSRVHTGTTVQTVQKDDSGRRLDRVLRKLLPQVPVSALYRSVRQGKIRVNGKKSNPESRVEAGDRIEFLSGRFPSVQTAQARNGADSPASQRAPAGADTRTPPQSPEHPAGKKTLTFQSLILFENDDVLALNKPAFLISCGRGSLAEMAGEYLRDKIPHSLSFRPGPLHRLDRETSGVLLFSKSLKGAQYLSRALRDGLLVKTYLAVLEGEFSGEELWEDYLIRDRRAKKTFAVSVTPGKTPQPGGEIPVAARKAITKVKALRSGGKTSLAELKIKTGRTHQIRAQAALHKHPLSGDKKYGSKGGAFYLHSRSIQFPADNPLGLPREIKAPPPEKNFPSRFRRCAPDVRVDSGPRAAIEGTAGTFPAGTDSAGSVTAALPCRDWLSGR